MNWNAIRLVCIFLIVMLPMTMAAQIVDEDEYEEFDTGESIIVQPRSYEPTILTVNLLQDTDVPVFVYLGGISWGTIFGTESSIEPFYSDIEIEKVKIRAADVQTSDFIKGDIKYTRPNKIDEDTLGYLTIYLKQLDSDTADICEDDAECGEGYQCDGICVPREVNLTLSAEMWFDQAERLYSLSKTALVVPQEPDEEEWVDSLEEYGSNYAFFGGRGLIRVEEIDGDKVELVVYSNKDLYWPILGAPRGITSLTLEEGKVSDYIDLGFTDEQALRNAKFRIQVTDIKDPAQERAVVRVNVGGKESQLVVTEGSALYPGSTWTVNSISYGVGRAGPEYTIQIRDAKGNKETIVTEYIDDLSDAESELLGKKFYSNTERGLTQEEEENSIEYTSSTKSIPSQQVEDLPDTFRNFAVFGGGNLDIDVDDVQDTSVKTRAYSIRSEATLKEVLIQILPAGLYYEVQSDGSIRIRNFDSTDPCEQAVTYDEGELPQTYSSADTEFYLNVACSAVEEYTAAVKDYSDVAHQKEGHEIGGWAYYKIAKVYEKMVKDLEGSLTDEEIVGARERALEGYQQAKELDFIPDDDVVIATKITNLENELVGNIEYGSETIEDNGKFVYVKLLSVEYLEPEDLSSADVSVDGITDTYYVGDEIVGDTDSTGTYDWVLTEVGDTYVRVKKTYSEALSSKARSTTERLSVDENEELSGSVVRLKDIDTKKDAHITIIPGSGTALRSISNFSVHIPIETRGIKLNIDKIDDKIEKMKARQETLQGIVDSLTKIVEYWNKACLAVFAFVSIKSSFFSASATARHDAVYGIDDKSGWNAYCQEESSGDYNDRKYKSYDACMMEHASDISDDIEAAEKAQEEVAALGGFYEGETWYQEATADYEDLDACRELIGDDAFLNEAALQEMAYYNALGARVSPESPIAESVETGKESYLGEKTANQEAKAIGCNAAVSAANDPDYQSEVSTRYKGDESRIEQAMKEKALGAYDSAFNNHSVSVEVIEIPAAKGWKALTNEYLGENSIFVVNRIFKDKSKSGTSVVFFGDEKVEVTELTLNEYKTVLKEKLDPIAELNDATNRWKIKEEYDNTDTEKRFSKLEDDWNLIYPGDGVTPIDLREEISAQDGEQFYIGDNGVIYVGSPAYSTDSLNEEFAQGAKLEIYGSGEYKGMPYCLPHKDGNFIKIIEYNKINEPDTMQYWNVGPDGELCSSDDVLVQHQSELYYSTANPSASTLLTFANTFVRKDYTENEVVKIDKHEFTVSFGKSKITLDGASASCYDSMDPQDCKLLFNTCDPVMCPPSRFNMNGRWNVDNVVESGFIGSIFLGQGTGDAVPICLTGVLASLNWWNSMLEGYVECLEAAKYEGDTVGICDKVRSVFWCEVATREVGSLLGYNGGMLDFLAEKFYGDRGNGGEYFKFKENMDNMQNAVTYFTTDYAATAFAAFKGRSFQEVGSEFCKQAIYSKMPWFQDFLAQVTTPEDPNQFYASLTVKPHSETLGLSAYQTYYHIYAGVNENIKQVTYSVYLRNSITGEVYYTTDSCESVTQSVELGEMKDETVDCVANEGFDEICVVLNGDTTCGFGSVTTSFAADFLKDSLVNDEVKRDIQSENECYPSASTASPSVSKIGSAGLTDSLVLPYSFGFLETGVQRVCSVQNPGSGQGNSGDWTIVGTCGENSEGQSLGSCWLNQDSYTIKDALKADETAEYLEKVNWNYSKTLLGVDQAELMTTEETIEFYKMIRSIVEEAGAECTDSKIKAAQTESGKGNPLSAQYDNALLQYNILIERTLSIDFAGTAQFDKGDIFATMLDDCKLKPSPQIDYTMELAGKTTFDTDVLPLAEGIVDFKVTFTNIPYKSTIKTTATQIYEDGTSKIISSGFECIYEDPADEYTDVICSSSGVDVDDETYTVEYEIEVTDDENDLVVLSKTFTLSRAADISSSSGVDVDFEEDKCSTCAGSNWAKKAADVCEMEICHDNADSCYSEDFLVWQSCNSCYSIKDDGDSGSDMCEKLDGDEDRCELKACYEAFLDDIGGECYWDDDKNECEYRQEEIQVQPGERVAPGTGSVSSVDVSDLGDGVEESSLNPSMKMTSEMKATTKLWVELVREYGYGGTIYVNDVYREDSHSSCDSTPSKHCSGNGIDIDVNNLDIEERLILLKAAIAAGYGEIFHGQEDKVKGISKTENEQLRCFWLGSPEHYHHIHLALEEGTQQWESCIDDTFSSIDEGDSSSSGQSRYIGGAPGIMGTYTYDDVSQNDILELMENYKTRPIEAETGEKRWCTCGENCEEIASYVSDYSRIYEVDPLLILSLIFIESNCVADVEGPEVDWIKSDPKETRKCQGLMQVCDYVNCGYEQNNWMDNLHGEENAEKNIACGLSLLNYYYEDVETNYASGREFICLDPEPTYEGWDLTVRNYNGWIGAGGSSNGEYYWCEKAGGQVHYVETAQEYYLTFAEKLGLM
jgi:hypothetical protein